MDAITTAGPRAVSRRVLYCWLGLLSLAQVADLITTQVDMSQGGVEANVVAANLMALGGIGLLTVVKIALVVAMAIAVTLIDRSGRGAKGSTAAMAHRLVWRGTQVCVVVLVATALHNAVVLSQLQS